LEILSPDAQLPMAYIRRAERLAEQTRYVARPGLRALPSGSLTVGAFVGMQLTSLVILLWAVWWPTPSTPGMWTFAVGITLAFVALIAIVSALLVRRHPGFLLAVLRAPFIRLTVTDRRIIWSLPWDKAPLMEIGHDRILGGILGGEDRRGAGSAAVMLVPGDPSADIDGAIHFDRLPNVRRFLEALGRR
jgi:hypothetical protein